MGPEEGEYYDERRTRDISETYSVLGYEMHMMRNKKRDRCLANHSCMIFVTQNSVAFIRRFIHEKKKKHLQKICKELINYIFSQISVLPFVRFLHTSKQCLLQNSAAQTTRCPSLNVRTVCWKDTGRCGGAFH